MKYLTKSMNHNLTEHSCFGFAYKSNKIFLSSVAGQSKERNHKGTMADKELYLWKEELNLLTRFHPENRSFCGLENDAVKNNDEELLKPVNNKNNKTNRMKGRRTKPQLRQEQDDGFIRRMIDDTLGCAHRNENIFNSRGDPRKTKKVLGNESSKTPLQIPLSSAPQMAKESSAEPVVSVRPRLTKKKNMENEYAIEEVNHKEKNTAYAIPITTSHPSPIVRPALMKSKGNMNIGNGYEKKKKSYCATSTSSPTTYFPPFDYAKFEKVSRPVWWAGKVST